MWSVDSSKSRNHLQLLNDLHHNKLLFHNNFVYMFHFSSQRNKNFSTKCWKIIFEVPNIVTTVWTEKGNLVFLMGEVIGIAFQLSLDNSTTSLICQNYVPPNTSQDWPSPWGLDNNNSLLLVIAIVPTSNDFTYTRALFSLFRNCNELQ